MSVAGPTLVNVTDTRGTFALTDMPGVRLQDADFTVVDVETTGWSPGAAGITEIGAVRVRGGEVITELTGISDPMLALAPPAAAVLPGLLTFAEGSVLTAHNAPFDLAFLTAACAAAGLGWPGFEILDTLKLARHLVSTPDEVPDCKLRTLADYFGALVQPSHRALADARATATVLGHLLGRLADREVYTLGELAAWLAEKDAEAAAARTEERRVGKECRSRWSPYH